MKRCILIIERNPGALDNVRDFLAQVGFDARTAPCAPNALLRALEDPADIALVDQGYAGVPGFEVVAEIVRALGSDFPVILLGGRSSTESLGRCLEAGAFSFLPDSEDLERLLAEILKVVGQRYGHGEGRP